MDLDRGTLSRIDRKVLSTLGRDESWHMVRVPASEATWLAWKRYCDALGISMGRAFSALAANELRSVVGDQTGAPVFLKGLGEDLSEREAALDTRKQKIAERERWIRESGRTFRAVAAPSRSWGGTARVGRNEPCPCGSGLKYKRCHGRE